MPPGSRAPGRAPSRSVIVASEAPRVACSRRAVASAARSARSRFFPASFSSSASLHPRRTSSANKCGYFETSSSPTGALDIPSKSPPIPTWSTPATRRTCSMWSATSARVADGRGRAASSAVRRRRSAGSLTLAISACASLRAARSSAAARDTYAGRKVTITTPPFPVTRRSTSSGTLRGTSVSARADECEKITGASLTRSASSIVSGDTCDRSTSIPSQFISRTTASPKAVSPPCCGGDAAQSAHEVCTLWVSVM